ncbi:baseplate hub [Vibrio phage K460]
MISVPWEENWGISYRITFGTRESVTYVVPPAIVSPEFSKPEDNQVQVPSQALVKHNLDDPRGFQMEFESSQMATSKGSESEESSLTLYNLSVEELRVINLPNCVFMVEAGFQGKVVLCYTGDVVRVDTDSYPPDVSYRITLSAAGSAMKDTMVNTHYDEGMSAKDVIIDMAGRFSGLAIGSYGLESESNYYRTGGRGFTGDLVTNFDRQMAKYNLQYAVVNGKVAIIPYRWKPEDLSKFNKTNFNIPAENIKGITEVKDNTGQSNDEVNNNLKTIQVNTLFLPVEIGQFITVPDSDYTKEFRGTYVVEGRRFILETDGGWDVVLQCKEVPL